MRKRDSRPYHIDVHIFNHLLNKLSYDDACLYASRVHRIHLLALLSDVVLVLALYAYDTFLATVATLSTALNTRPFHQAISGLKQVMK